MNDAIRYWVTNARDTFYIIGTVLVLIHILWWLEIFKAVIGYEARKQILKRRKLPDYVVACIGGGSNAIGMFSHFLEDTESNLCWNWSRWFRIRYR